MAATKMAAKNAMAAAKMAAEEAMAAERALVEAESLLGQFAIDIKRIGSNLNTKTPREILDIEGSLFKSRRYRQFVDCMDRLAASTVLDDHKDTGHRYLVKCHFEIQLFHRKLGYLARGRELWALPVVPLDIFMPNHRWHLEDNRCLAAGRIVKLLEQETVGGLTDAWDEQLDIDYCDVIDDPSELENKLPPRYSSLIKMTKDLDLESEILMYYIGFLTGVECDPEEMLTLVLFDLQDIVPVPSTEQFTTVPTAEELAAADDPCCFVCTRPYYSAPTDEEPEDPVKMKCGHIIGRQCLQTWVESGLDDKPFNDRCPYRCHQRIFAGIELLPKDIMESVSAQVKHRATLRELNRRIDMYLLQGVNLRTYEPAFGKLLHELNAWIVRDAKVASVLQDAVTEYIESHSEAGD